MTVMMVSMLVVMVIMTDNEHGEHENDKPILSAELFM